MKTREIGRKRQKTKENEREWKERKRTEGSGRKQTKTEENPEKRKKMKDIYGKR